MNTDETSSLNILPRPDLRKEAFLRYAPAIAMGMVKDTLIDPKPLSPDTYVARFNDAKLAYKRYSYRYEYIKPGTDLKYIKAFVLNSGKVVIRNTTPTKLEPSAEDLTIDAMCRVPDASELTPEQISLSAKLSALATKPSANVDSPKTPRPIDDTLGQVV